MSIKKEKKQQQQQHHQYDNAVVDTAAVAAGTNYEMTELRSNYEGTRKTSASVPSCIGVSGTGNLLLLGLLCFRQLIV